MKARPHRSLEDPPPTPAHIITPARHRPVADRKPIASVGAARHLFSCRSASPDPGRLAAGARRTRTASASLGHVFRHRHPADRLRIWAALSLIWTPFGVGPSSALRQIAQHISCWPPPPRRSCPNARRPPTSTCCRSASRRARSRSSSSHGSNRGSRGGRATKRVGRGAPPPSVSRAARLAGARRAGHPREGSGGGRAGHNRGGRPAGGTGVPLALTATALSALAFAAALSNSDKTGKAVAAISRHVPSGRSSFSASTGHFHRRDAGC